MKRCSIAIVGSGFAGSLLARVLTVLGHRVVLLERGTHPRFAIGESSTPLANLSLERLARRYDLPDCYDLAAHGRWVTRFPDLRRGLKRGFTFYRHHPGQPFANRGLDSERLLVAASPSDAVADTHWLRADVDHHFVRAAALAGVDYRDRVELIGADIGAGGVRLTGRQNGKSLDLPVDFVIDASGGGQGGFLSRQLSIASGLDRMQTDSGLVFSHFDGVRPMPDVVPGLPPGPYPDDWAAVHHVIDEGWMYALRFDHGVTSAGFALTPRGLANLGADAAPDVLWRVLLERYPSIGAAFSEATPLMPLAFRSRMQHRLTRAAGERWVLLPHAYAFVDPLFSTGIAWSLRAIERLGLCFEHGARAEDLERYATLLSDEADQIDRLVAGAYRAMQRFDLFAAHAMIYFATVSFAEVQQRLVNTESETAAWSGFLGIGDPVLEPLPRESLRRLGGRGFGDWVADAIAPRNIGGFADPARHNLYPLDLDVLVDRHAMLGLSREALVSALPALRGMTVSAA
jgi:FADH2 O2-dependent halogenase